MIRNLLSLFVIFTFGIFLQTSSQTGSNNSMRLNVTAVKPNLNLTCLVKSMENCTVNFFNDEAETVIDFATIQTPFIIQTRLKSGRQKEGNGTVSKIRMVGRQTKSCSFSFIQNKNQSSQEFEEDLEEMTSSSETFIIMTPLSNEHNIRNKSEGWQYSERYYLLYGNDSEFKKAYYKCTICQAGDEVIQEVSCDNRTTSCFSSMMAAKESAIEIGSGIVWETGDISTSLLAFKKKRFKSTRKRWFFDLENTKWESVAEFLTATWNSTSIQNLSMENSAPGNLKHAPFFGTTTFWHPTESGQPFTAFVLGRKPGFNFITSDSVVALNSDFATLTNPIDSSTWYLLLGTSILASVLVSGIMSLENSESSCKNSSACVFLKSLIWMLGICVEQCHKGVPVTPTNIRMSAVVKVMFGLWVLVIIVITNGYKSALGSDLTTLVRTKSKWTRLEQIANFTLFLPFKKDISCDKLKSGSMRTWDKVLLNTDGKRLANPCLCHMEKKYELAGTSSWKRREEFCRFPEELHQVKEYIEALSDLKTQNKISWGEWQTLVDRKPLPSFRKGFNKVFFFYEEDLEHVLLKNLNQNKTAFITDQNQVEHYLRRFNNLPRRNDRWDLKWNSNADSKDDILRRTEYLYVSDKDEPMFLVIPNRVRVLLQSGIYWLWERWWDNGLYRLRKVESEKSLPRPLNIFESHLYSVFWIFFLGLAISVFQLILEVSWYFVMIILDAISSNDRKFSWGTPVETF